MGSAACGIVVQVFYSSKRALLNSVLPEFAVHAVVDFASVACACMAVVTCRIRPVLASRKEAGHRGWI